MTVPSPLPQVGQNGQVVLGGMTLSLVPGTYTVEEAPRFGEKISTGAIRYQDFNPYESAHAVSSLVGGYGLRDYTDLPENAEAETQGITMYLEADGIDCRDGKIILGPYQRPIPLSGATESPVWIGEFPVAYGRGPYGGQTVLLVITGTRIYKINTDYSTTLLVSTLPANAVKGTIGVFGTKLIIGFGSAAQAVYTEDLGGFNQLTQAISGTVRSPIYAYAFASDQAAAYIAGGPITTNTNTVMSSADGGSDYDLTLTYCGGEDAAITSLAPGGGVFLVLVGKTNELGAVDLQGIYRTLYPYDSRLDDNTNFLRWALATPSRESQGPLSVFFPKDRSLYQFQPTSESAGRVRNVSPWDTPGIRPLTIRGSPTAFQGSSRWGFWSLTNIDGNSWVIARDYRSGAHHPIATLGEYACNALCLSSIIPTSGGDNAPHLFIAKGTNLVSIDLPIDGEFPPDDPNCLYMATGTLDLPAITLGFPDEYKINFYIRLVASNLLPAKRNIELLYALDDDTTYSSLGYISESPAGEVSFPISTCKRVKVRLVLRTDDITETPIVHGLSVRLSLNSKLYRIWTFQAYVPTATSPYGGADLQNPWTLVNEIWRAREDGLPIDFVDRWNIPWVVRPLRVKETETIRQPGGALETVLDMALLQFAPGGGNLIYDDAFSIYDQEDQRYGE